MYDLSALMSGIMGGYTNNFPGAGSMQEQGWSGMGSMTGGPRQQQQFVGAAGAGRLGPGFGPPRGDIADGPMMSNMPGYSYKTRGSAPRYHEEIPMGGTPGVWAIRNDELLRGGPEQDAWWIKRAENRHRGRRGFTNRFNNRRRM
jgi:hypothetical protein